MPQSVFATVPPLVLSSFSTAAVMYPIDLIKELRMGNVGSGKTVLELLNRFRATYGLFGFFTQGIAPEVARAGWMRALKFFLFPRTFEALYGKPPSKGKVRRRQRRRADILSFRAPLARPSATLAARWMPGSAHRPQNQSALRSVRLARTPRWPGGWGGGRGRQARRWSARSRARRARCPRR